MVNTVDIVGGAATINTTVVPSAGAGGAITAAGGNFGGYPLPTRGNEANSQGQRLRRMQEAPSCKARVGVSSVTM